MTTTVEAPTDAGYFGAFSMTYGGRAVEGAGGNYPIMNPSTEEVMGHAPEASIEQVREAIAAAKAAVPGWAATPSAERARLLRAWADRLDADKEAWYPLLGAEMGGTEKGSAGKGVDVALHALRMTANRITLNLDENFPPRVAAGEVLSGVAVRKPLGVVAIWGAYNAAMVNIATMGGPALAVGNTVVLKPPPQCPIGILELARTAQEVGFPPGVVNVVSGTDVEIGVELARHPDVHGIGFTGSPKVGVEIAKTAAERLKPMLLELGGKGACIVLDDADLDKAVKTLALTWVFHSGQICGAPTRAVVHEKVKDKLVEKLIALGSTLKIGPTDDPSTQVGPVINAAQRERIEAYVRSAVDEGATVALGGERPANSPGFYAAPTLLLDCKPEMKAVREEIFGPVISLITVSSDDEAVEVANDSDYGLVNYVFSEDSVRALNIANRLISGNVNVNTHQGGGNGIEEMPFGGRKFSGFGRKGGKHALEAFSTPLGITVAS